MSIDFFTAANVRKVIYLFLFIYLMFCINNINVYVQKKGCLYEAAFQQGIEL
jgi:hypothetical protein